MQSEAATHLRTRWLAGNDHNQTVSNNQIQRNLRDHSILEAHDRLVVCGIPTWQADA